MILRVVGVSMGIRLLGINRVVKNFEKKIDRLENPTKIFKIISTMAWKDVMDHFEKEQGPSGKWKNLKYPREKRQGQGSGRDKVLQDTGFLRSRTRKRAFPKRAEVFNPLKYAAVHNGGLKVPDRTPKTSGGYLTFRIRGQWVKTKFAKGFRMPKREFMWLSSGARSRIAKRFIRFVMRGEK